MNLSPRALSLFFLLTYSFRYLSPLPPPYLFRNRETPASMIFFVLWGSGVGGVMSSNIYQMLLEPSWKNSFQRGISTVRLEFGQQRTHASLLIFSDRTPVKRWPLKLFYIKVKVCSVTLRHWPNATAGEGGLYVQWIITIYPKSAVFHEADRGQCHFCFVLVQL